jgi:hypothetical protein
MRSRRFAYIVSALLLLMVIGSALAEREARRTQAVAPPVSAGTAAAAPAAEASAELPPDRVVRARVGEIVSLTVRTPEPDTATIRDIGVSASTSQDVPGTLEFVAAEPGRYPVLLEDSGKVAGTVVVTSDQ